MRFYLHICRCAKTHNKNGDSSNNNNDNNENNGSSCNNSNNNNNNSCYKNQESRSMKFCQLPLSLLNCFLLHKMLELMFMCWMGCVVFRLESVKSACANDRPTKAVGGQQPVLVFILVFLLASASFPTCSKFQAFFIVSIIIQHSFPCPSTLHYDEFSSRHSTLCTFLFSF